MVKNNENYVIYIAEGTLWAFLTGAGTYLGVMKNPIIGSIVLAGVVHGTACLLQWMARNPPESVEKITASDAPHPHAHATLDTSQQNHRSLQMKQKMEEKEHRISRAECKRNVIIGIRSGLLTEESNEEEETSLFLKLPQLVQQSNFSFFSCFEDQLFSLGIQNELPENPLDKEISLLVFANKNYAIQIRQFRDSNVNANGVKDAANGAIARENMIPVVITTSGFTESAIEEARELKVELIDGMDIQEWHNPERKRSHEQEQHGFYEFLQSQLTLRYGTAVHGKKTGIIVCIEDRCEGDESLAEEFKSDYLKIASVLLPEYDIQLELVKNEENLPIFPLVKGNLDKDKKREIASILKRPVLATLHEEQVYRRTGIAPHSCSKIAK